ncbi:MAG: protein phosphatase 2C domain-containing protein [Gemmatimonadota bacterium]
MSWQHAQRSDTGRVRPQNEDSLLVRPDLGVYAVADGMGGHAAGEVASAIAVQTIEREAETAVERGAGPYDVAADAVRTANTAILDEARRDAAKQGMGTTASVLITPDDARFRIAHVGDSRVYLLRDEALSQLTVDHTGVHEQVRRGALTEEDARRHPFASVLTRVLGTDVVVDVDLIDGDARPGDLFLICSDGLTAVLDDAALHVVLGRPDSLQARADALVRAAIEGGGPDNITVVLVARVD